MSKAVELPDPPAFVEPGSDPAVFTPVEDECAQLLVAGMSEPARVLRLGGAAAGVSLTGHFRVEENTGRQQFVRVLSAARESQCREVAALLRSMPPGAPIVPTRVNLLDDRRIAIWSPWIEHRSPRATEADMQVVGRAAAALHAILREHPERPTIAARAQERRGALADRLSRPLPDRARRLVAKLEGDLGGLDDLAAQPLHGDMNPGNILLTDSDVRFCDFENVVYAYGPPILDLALIVERIALTAENGFDVARALLVSWQAVSGVSPIPRLGALEQALRARNLQVAAILVLLEERGTPAAESEWQKFERLATTLDERRGMIRAIEGAFA